MLLSVSPFKTYGKGEGSQRVYENRSNNRRQPNKEVIFVL